MSTKIKKQLADSDKKYQLEDYEMRYLNDIETVERSFIFYFHQLKQNYLHQLAVKLGYLPDAKLEFTIDLKDPNRELTVKEVKD